MTYSTNKITVGPLLVYDPIFRVLENLREADIKEIKALNREPVVESVLMAIRSSDLKWVAYADGEPVCLFGCALVVDTDIFGERKLIGRPWLVGTDEVGRHPVALYRKSERFIDMMRHRYKRLENYVHRDNVLSVRWLRWLGFRMDSYGSEFYRFWMNGGGEDVHTGDGADGGGDSAAGVQPISGGQGTGGGRVV